MTDTIITSSNNTTVIAEREATTVVNESSKEPTVVITGVMGPPGSANVSIGLIKDVDLTQLVEGSTLVYNATTQKWVATNLLDHQIVESGQF